MKSGDRSHQGQAEAGAAVRIRMIETTETAHRTRSFCRRNALPLIGNTEDDVGPVRLDR